MNDTEDREAPVGGGDYQVAYNNVDLVVDGRDTAGSTHARSPRPSNSPSFPVRILKELFRGEKEIVEETLNETLIRLPASGLKDGGTGVLGNCFICLEDDRKRQLLSCCSQCSAVTHKKCWYQWRRKQRLTTLRARLLATNISDPLGCTICKTGIAQIEGEEDHLAWAAGGTDPVQQRLQDRLLSVLGRMLQSARGDDEESVSLPQSVLQRVAIIAGSILSVAILIDVLLFTLTDISYWGFIVIPTFALLYLIGSLSCLAISIYQRKLALGPLRQRPLPPRAPRLTPRAAEAVSQQMPLEALVVQGRRVHSHDLYAEVWDSFGHSEVVVFYKSNLP
eukprot:Gregarina_sp_Poly_1__6423@NODE_342_length_9417_cov_265_709412_g286_i0_p2_GENE_NODE_342_length_9417_cov_265_709412_g286_i0NODE_342_length_9417_cov_265_709412_g286_i0_p2_ORF_typecomplete_len345_score42_72FANCL_C/PF11793_8/0_034ProkRING_1/PF14446_6/0_016ProkRING_1/PF14446_6/1_3e03Zn_ribbon_17/PF17120_5/0_1RINGv/PF12906_7/0_11zfRING_2/PF13639_6/0_16PHD/PF00628_29/0_74PHD/PF00628_29/2_8e03_NODE_342_length_9417_cov_265_709412_g286_i0301037